MDYNDALLVSRYNELDGELTIVGIASTLQVAKDILFRDYSYRASPAILSFLGKADALYETTQPGGYVLPVVHMTYYASYGNGICLTYKITKVRTDDLLELTDF